METPMQQLLNQLRFERASIPMLIEWERCYQAIEMVIKNTYLPLEKQQIMDTHNKGYYKGYMDNGKSPEQYYDETFNES